MFFVDFWQTQSDLAINHILHNVCLKDLGKEIFWVHFEERSISPFPTISIYLVYGKRHHLTYILIVVCKYFQFEKKNRLKFCRLVKDYFIIASNKLAAGNCNASFNPFPNKPWFLRFCNRSLLKTLWEKEKLLVTSNFSFTHSVFYLFGEPSSIFIKFRIVVCKLWVWKSLKFVVW